MKKVGQAFRAGMVTHIKKGIEKRKNTFLVSYSGLSGPEMNTFRKGMKQVGADLHVSRNNIAQLALKDLKLDKLAERIAGQTAFVWSDTDAAEVSKRLIKFTKESERIVLQGGLLDGVALEKKDVERLSDLPSREVLLTMLLRTLNSPITRLAMVLNGKTRDLLSVLKQLSEKKGGN